MSGYKGCGATLNTRLAIGDQLVAIGDASSLDENWSSDDMRQAVKKWLSSSPTELSRFFTMTIQNRLLTANQQEALDIAIIMTKNIELIQDERTRKYQENLTARKKANFFQINILPKHNVLDRLPARKEKSKYF